MNPYRPKDIRPPARQLVQGDLSESIVGAFFEVYNELGYGLLEVFYSRALAIALRDRGHIVDREHEVLVAFRGELLGKQRIDMLVDRSVVIEVKSTEKVAEAHWRQVRNYVTLAGVDLGLLLHFGPTPQFHRVLARRPQTRAPINTDHTDHP